MVIVTWVWVSGHSKRPPKVALSLIKLPQCGLLLSLQTEVAVIRKTINVKQTRIQSSHSCSLSKLHRKPFKTGFLIG